MGTSIDLEASRQYRERLAAHFTGRVLDAGGQFMCPEAPACRGSAEAAGFAFAGGQLSYVGDAYAASVDGRPFRVLVVSMQVGDAEAPVGPARRIEQVVERIPQRPGKRNPHMRGVTRALQLLYGLPVSRDGDPADERLTDGTHVLRAYAMANSTLCSALPTGAKSRRGKPTSTMLARCAPHLEATVRELAPTVMQVQGADTRAALDALATTVERFSNEVTVIDITGRRVVSCATSHPSSGPPSSWSSLEPESYFADVVAPALQLTRKLALAVD